MEFVGARPESDFGHALDETEVLFPPDAAGVVKERHERNRGFADLQVFAFLEVKAAGQNMLRQAPRFASRLRREQENERGLAARRHFVVGLPLAA